MIVWPRTAKNVNDILQLKILKNLLKMVSDRVTSILDKFKKAIFKGSSYI